MRAPHPLGIVVVLAVGTLVGLQWYLWSKPVPGLLATSPFGGVSLGNARDTGAGTKGWFVGHFIKDAMRHSTDVEVKWGVHKQGERNGQFSTNRISHTLSILVRGKFRLFFKDPDNPTNRVEEITLQAEGDYALWDKGVPHDWVVDEDAVVATVRWPSIPKDQS